MTPFLSPAAIDAIIVAVAPAIAEAVGRTVEEIADLMRGKLIALDESALPDEEAKMLRAREAAMGRK